MGRYVSGQNGVQPRSEVMTFTESNPAVPVPDWARNGKAILRVSGCGGGGAGGVNDKGINVNVAGNPCGGSGGAGGYASGLLVPIPAGLTSIGVLIGAAGIAPTTTVAINGADGGSTVLTVGSRNLYLKGGKGGRGSADSVNSSGGPGGEAGFGEGGDTAGGGSMGSRSRLCLAEGSNGFGNSSSPVYGGSSEFGSCGALPVPQTQHHGYNGAEASGFGAGGGGAAFGGNNGDTSLRLAQVKAGSGAPGLLIIEFIEGAQA